MSENNYGIWIGENSTVATLGEMTISFLRLEKDLIASILSHSDMGVLGVAYGHGTAEKHNHTAAIICDSDKNFIKNNDEATDFIKLHSDDKITYDEQNNKLIYKTYNNRVFENVLAEKIELSDFERKNEIDNSLSVAEKMARWDREAYLNINPKQIRADIDTRKYSIFFCIDFNGNQYDTKYNEFIYCRVGQNGFCEKGRAMLPIIQVRHHYTGMVDDNLSSIKDYKPDENCFVEDSCTFPADGGWYWSLKKVTDDVIYLQGCGGDVYEIHRT
ncbi:MAG: hypothetical protein FWD71_12730 [Oscillospiraceae bacterium]|nr:hypothetical protein [Oscillospiraceae bacterium]